MATTQTLTIAGHDWTISRRFTHSVILTCACGCGATRIVYTALGEVQDADQCHSRGKRTTRTFRADVA